MALRFLTSHRHTPCRRLWLPSPPSFDGGTTRGNKNIGVVRQTRCRYLQTTTTTSTTRSQCVTIHPNHNRMATHNIHVPLLSQPIVSSHRRWNAHCCTPQRRCFASTDTTSDKDDNDSDDDEEEAVDSDYDDSDIEDSDDDADEEEDIASDDEDNNCKEENSLNRSVPRRKNHKGLEEMALFEKRRQDSYRKWQGGVGKKPAGILVDSAGKEVFSPQISSDFCITGNDESLPPALQKAVQDHIFWACEQDHTIPNDRNMARHYRLDSRASLKKSKKDALRKEIVATPFVLIGAYQNLLRRARQYPYGDDTEDLAGSNIRNARIPFWAFQDMSFRLMGIFGSPELPRPGKMPSDVKVLIQNEAMAMLMRPVMEPFLPDYAWSLQTMSVDGYDGGAWKFIEGVAHLKNLMREQVSYDPSLHTLMTWDLGVQGHVELNAIQIKAVCNIVSPYVSNWWPVHLHRLVQAAGQGVKKKRRWRITDDKYSSLPATLADLHLLRLDYSDNLKLNPLFAQVKAAKLSDRKKKTIGVKEVRNIPEKISDLDYVHLNYHRWGPKICFSYKGPDKMKEKLAKAVSTDLKSSLAFPKKLINNLAYEEQQPSKPKTKQQKIKMKEAEARFAEQALRADIAQAGTGKTRNSKRIALQLKGRILEEEGRLHLNKKGLAK